LATAANSVTVNGSAADYRRGEYFQESVSVSNGSGAVWQSVTVNAGTASSSGNRFVPPATESYGSTSNPSTYPGYDLDGNLLRDGRWKYTWDGENRLTKMEPLDYVTPPTGSRRQLDFEYDALGRRIKKTVTNLDTSAVTTTKFLYDGWNLMAELDGSNTLVRTYQWGLDLSGSLLAPGGRLWILPGGDSIGESWADSVLQRVVRDRFCRLIRLPEGRQPSECRAEELEALVKQ